VTGFEAVRDAVVAKIGAVSGVGKVYGYLRLVTSEAAIAADMVTDDRLNYWAIAPAGGDPHIYERHTTSHGKHIYQYDVHAYYALDESGASEQAFTTIVEAVMADFETGDKKLNGVVEVAECGPLQWRESDQRMLVNVLCHHARLSLRATEHPD
jgi:hypothetical protein